MIHSVLCASTAERDAAVQVYTDAGLVVNVVGPDAVVRAEKFTGTALAACPGCAVGPNGYLVVARSPGVASS